MDIASLIKKAFSQDDKKKKNYSFDPKAQRIAATGLAVGVSLGALLGGLSAVLLSLKNIHLYLELGKDKGVTKEDPDDDGVFGSDDNMLHKHYQKEYH